MDRFTPDVFLEWLLRPFLMADPSAFLYVEFMAPDLRPALLMTVLFVGAVFGSLKGRLTAETWRLLMAFWLSFYLWTFVIGNGRYFLSALLLLGPLILLAWRGLPGTKPFRWATLVLIGGLQAAVLASTYKPDVWGRADWVSGPGIDIEKSPLRHRPAVFIMASVNAYSVLVPRFHPDSRWAQLVGQRDISPAMPEYATVVQLLSSALPKLLVIPIPGGWSDKDNQPDLELRKLLGQSLSTYGLALNGQPCTVLRSTLPSVSAGMAMTSQPGVVPKDVSPPALPHRLAHLGRQGRQLAQPIGNRRRRLGLHGHAAAGFGNRIVARLDRAQYYTAGHHVIHQLVRRDAEAKDRHPLQPDVGHVNARQQRRHLLLRDRPEKAYPGETFIDDTALQTLALGTVAHEHEVEGLVRQQRGGIKQRIERIGQALRTSVDDDDASRCMRLIDVCSERLGERLAGQVPFVCRHAVGDDVQLAQVQPALDQMLLHARQHRHHDICTPTSEVFGRLTQANERMAR